MPNEGGELAVRRVVDRLDADDLGFQGVVVMMHVLEELQLCRPRSDDEDLVRVGEHHRNLVKVVRRVRWMRLLGRDA